METQKINDFYDEDEEEDDDRGPVVAHLALRAQNITYDLYRGSNLIGRADNNDVQVDDTTTTVSQMHAEIEISDKNEAMVKDFKSSNGTFIETAQYSNEYVQLQKKQKLLLRDGCVVRLGNIIIYLCIYLSFSL
jgi:pSer/pThr/pTyr-binding forkhead associated (FHA) protein